MPSQAQVQQTILSAQLLTAHLVNANGVALTGGVLTARWDRIDVLTCYTAAVLNQYTLQDYSSANFLTCYDRLVSLIGVDTTVNSIDPNFQPADGMTIIVESGGSVNSAKINFANQTTVALVSYQANYSGTYGQNPFVTIWTGVSPTFTQDTGTVPTVNYVGGLLDSITWTYPIGTSGYIQILGT